MSISAPKKKTFRSRISILLVLFILAAFTPAVLSVCRYGTGHPAVYIIGGVILFTVLLLTGIRYTISDGKIFVHIWSIPNGSVNITDIRSVRRSYNPLSSPAASLKRLRINIRIKGAKYDYMLISPVREREFIDELRAIDPDIAVNAPEKRVAWRIWDWDI